MLSRTSAGTRPAGAENEQQAAAWVRGMFGRIAPRYDLLNHLLSMNIDRYWRARTVKLVSPVLAKPGVRVLDVACGTGDLVIALAKRGRRAVVLGSDFSHPMLTAARSKTSLGLMEADALALPVGDASFELVTIAFGFRNLANYWRGLVELHRVLKPGGVLAILEFSTPPNAALAALYSFYSRNVLPRIGGWISGSRDAYTYLPESVRKFPDAEGLAQQIRETGFKNVHYERMTAGIVALHLAERA